MPLIINRENARKTARMPWWRRRRATGLRPLAERPGPLPTKIFVDETQALPKIPMEQWPDVIAANERLGATPYHFWKSSKIRCKDQKQLGWCHAASAVFGNELERGMQGLPHVELSIASVAGPVTGFRNAGAWIIDDLQQMAKGGAASTDFVPELQVARSGWKPGAVENAELHRVKEYFRTGSDFVAVGTALLLGYVVCVGLNWWGHAVTYVRLIDAYRHLPATDWRRYRIGSVNSWGESYGERGYFELEGSHMRPDESYVPTLVRSAIDTEIKARRRELSAFYGTAV